MTEDYWLNLSNEILFGSIPLLKVLIALMVEWLTKFRNINNTALLLFLAWAGYLAWLVRDLILGNIAPGLVPVIFTLEILLLTYLCVVNLNEMQSD